MGNGVQFRTKYEQLQQQQQLDSSGLANGAATNGVGGNGGGAPQMTVINMEGHSGMGNGTAIVSTTVDIPMEETRPRKGSTAESLKMKYDEEDEDEDDDVIIGAEHANMNKKGEKN